MTFESISHAKAYTRLATELGLSEASENIRDVVFAEHIRSAVYGYAAIYETGISSLKLSSMLRRNLRSFSGEVFSFEDETKILKEFGDIHKYGGSYWVPVASYGVRITSSTAFVISGAPSNILRNMIGFPINIVGHIRLIAGDFSKSKKFVIRDFDNWLGVPYKDLHEWATLFLKHSENIMESDIPPGDFVWYNGKGWSPLDEADNSRSEILLARRSHFWVNEYCLIKFQVRNGEVHPFQFLKIDYDDAKRLQITINQWKRINVYCQNDFFSFSLRMRLPFPERKILLLGQKSISLATDDVTYRFHKELWPLVEISLKNLGFRLNYKEGRL